MKKTETIMKKAYLLPFFAVLLIGCTTTQISNESEKTLNVPFTSQAPYGDWSEPWQNACEETSIVMINGYYSNDPDFEPEEAKKEILEVFEAKKDTIQFSKDENLETIVEIINNLDLNWTAQIKENPSIEDLISEIEKQRPILIPIYAPEINNPFYLFGGPDYHVVIIVGYDQSTKTFTINDPGTKNGKQLEFGYTTILNAIHDLNESNYNSGPKRVLFTKPRGILDLPDL